MKLTEDRAVIVGKGKLKVRVTCHGRGEQKLRKKVITKGILHGGELCEQLGISTGTMRGMMTAFARILRAGYEVRFGASKDDAIRLYPCLNENYSKMFVAAATVGNGFRECVSDNEFTLCRKGDEIDAADAIEEEEVIAREHEAARCVTPDTKVVCPACGYEFRVGKYLADTKN